MKLRVLEPFYDIEAAVMRQKDDEFETSAARGNALVSHGNKAKRPLCVEVVKPKKADKPKA